MGACLGSGALLGYEDHGEVACDLMVRSHEPMPWTQPRFAGATAPPTQANAQKGTEGHISLFHFPAPLLSSRPAAPMFLGQKGTRWLFHVSSVSSSSLIPAL